MISVENLSVQFYGEYLFQNVSFKISPSDKIAVIGPNGCGKTTILKIIAGEQSPESGQLNIQKGINIGYLQQDFISESTEEFLFAEVYKSNKEISDLEKEEKEVLEKLKESENQTLVNRLGELHLRLEKINTQRYKSEVEKILVGLGFREKDFSRPIREFSGGWRMRVAIAKLLVSNNDVLLLDEPTNHLDLDSLEFLIDWLKRFKGAVLIVSHDRFFLNNVTNKTLGFSYNEVSLISCDVTHFLEVQEQRREQLSATYRNQQLKIKQIERFIEKFRYKATKARQVQSRIKMLDKIDKVELMDDENSISFNFNNAPPSGKVVYRLVNLTKKYDEDILSDAELEIEKEDKIAVLGANGTGKTTLAKILAGVESYQSGTCIPGHNVIVGYYSQDIAENLNPNLTVLETVENIDPSKTIGNLRTLLGCFLFNGDDVFKKVRVLSGGEKSRLALAKILLQPCNFLIMDEPTNHLDIQSKKILQEALMDYNGSLLIVSHDVEFLQPVINKIIEIKDKKIKVLLNTIDEYLQKYNSIEPEVEIQNTKEKKIDQRKIQKRVEAEQRQKLYQTTKDLKKKISKVESEIARLEEMKNKFELELNSDSFSERTDHTDFFAKYKSLSIELEVKFSEWEELSTKCHNAEEDFNKANN